MVVVLIIGAVAFGIGVWLGVRRLRPWWGRYFFIKPYLDLKGKDRWLLVDFTTGEVLAKHYTYSAADWDKVERLANVALGATTWEDLANFDHLHEHVAPMARRKWIREYGRKQA